MLCHRHRCSGCDDAADDSMTEKKISATCTAMEQQRFQRRQNIGVTARMAGRETNDFNRVFLFTMAGLWCLFPETPPIVQNFFLKHEILRWIATTLLFAEGVGIDESKRKILFYMFLMFIVHKVLMSASSDSSDHQSGSPSSRERRKGSKK